MISKIVAAMMAMLATEATNHRVLLTRRSFAPGGYYGPRRKMHKVNARRQGNRKTCPR